MKVDRKSVSIAASAAVIAGFAIAGGIALASTPGHNTPAQQPVVRQAVVKATPTPAKKAVRRAVAPADAGSVKVQVPVSPAEVSPVDVQPVPAPADVPAQTDPTPTDPTPAPATPAPGVETNVPDGQGTVGSDGITRPPSPSVMILRTAPPPVIENP